MKHNSHNKLMNLLVNQFNQFNYQSIRTFIPLQINVTLQMNASSSYNALHFCLAKNKTSDIQNDSNKKQLLYVQLKSIKFLKYEQIISILSGLVYADQPKNHTDLCMKTLSISAD